MRLKAEEKKQSITFQGPETLCVKLDPTQLHRVVENYLSNAIRYSGDGGSIEVLLEKRENELVVQVRDSGRGIPQEELENIFLPFYRAGEKVEGSTGLGLSIVKGIVEAHKGRCWAESEGEGKGSRFFFTLPMN